jgi:hypothetical protein
MKKLFLILIVSPLLANATPINFNAREKIIGRAAQWRRPSQQRVQQGEVFHGRVNLSGYKNGTPTRTSRQSGYGRPPPQKERRLLPIPTNILRAHTQPKGHRPAQGPNSPRVIKLQPPKLPEATSSKPDTPTKVPDTAPAKTFDTTSVTSSTTVPAKVPDKAPAKTSALASAKAPDVTTSKASATTSSAKAPAPTPAEAANLALEASEDTVSASPPTQLGIHFHPPHPDFDLINKTWKNSEPTPRPVPNKGVLGPDYASEGEIVKAEPPPKLGITFHAPPPGFDPSTLDFGSDKTNAPGPPNVVPFGQWLISEGFAVPNPKV